eukprot:TRINITY_DN80759_c0_g1_i1.p1 TRINITY_DN80759_c0_g1~~TRINITY_DN80759_c0_g1_i1.p1  ORF type:complete len:424 (-),score=89.37 TRINITY_DN80759_c0_g1_i1:121-1392(-)
MVGSKTHGASSARGRSARLLVCGAACGGALCVSTIVNFALPASEALRGSERRREAGLTSGRRSLLLSGGVAAATSVVGPEAAQAKLTADELKRAAVFKQAAPSITGITTKEVSGRGQAPPYLGSGFVWDNQHVVTNYHVISQMAEKKETPYVTFLTKDKDGESLHYSLPTTIIATDGPSDLAVLKVKEESDLMLPLSIGSSEDLRVGQEVYALGNPLGLEHSMSKGVVSGMSRTMDSAAGGRPIHGVIQTDASINPGNSGGPLLDSDGNVIGVNTAILSTSGLFAGVGLAIPIDVVRQNVDEIVARGYVERPSLGVILAPDSMSEVLGVSGVMVQDVVKGSAADKAGLRGFRHGVRLGDVITSVSGRRVGQVDDVYKALEDKTAGDILTVSLQRASDEGDERLDTVQLDVRLGLAPRTIVRKT